MPNAYVLNALPGNYGTAVSQLVEMLVSAGWSYKASGDGLSGFSSTGKIFTSTNAVALGWHNARAWARVTDPASGREFVFQHDAASNVRIKYSRSAKFTGGTPSATVTPTATDERYIRGGATDATPTYGTWLDNQVSIGRTRFQGVAYATAPYGFWFVGQQSPGGTVTASLMMDPVVSVAEDIDPVVFYVSAGSFVITNGLNRPPGSGSWAAPGGSADGPFGHMDVTAATFVALGVTMQTCAPSGATAGTAFGPGGYGLMTPLPWNNQFGDGLNNGSVNLNNGKRPALPVLYMRPAGVTGMANYGVKGHSTLMRLTMRKVTSFTSNMQNHQWICVNDVWLRWGGGPSELRE